MSTVRMVEQALTDRCRTCAEPVQYASIDRAPFAWTHVLERGHHDAVPASLTLRKVTERFEEEGE